MSFFFFIFLLTNFRSILYILDTNLCSCVFAEFVVQSLGHVTLRPPPPSPWTAAQQAPLSSTISWEDAQLILYLILYFHSMFSVPQSVFVLYIDLYFLDSTYK